MVRPSRRGKIRAWDTIVDPQNLWGAWCDFARGKHGRADVAGFSVDAERHVLRLARELASGAWQPGRYRLVRIVDPKRRLVAAAPVRDRVVHHAVHRVLAPTWNRSFIDHSYACLPGRGTHRALLRFARNARRHRFVLLLDISRYFYRIDRDRLRSLLHRRLPEPPLRGLVDTILDSGAGLYRSPAVASWLGWAAPGEAGRGVPIGNLTSQWWGNVYLEGLDHHVSRKLGMAYQRYMDDLTLFSDDPGALLAARYDIRGWLHEHRGLDLKAADAVPVPTRGAVPYLGHVVTPNGIRIGRKARGRIPSRLRKNLRWPRRLAQAVRSYKSVWMFGV